jgi:hypothetical protein
MGIADFDYPYKDEIKMYYKGQTCIGASTVVQHSVIGNNNTWTDTIANAYVIPDAPASSGIIDNRSDELERKIDNLESLFFRKVVSKCPAC